MNKYFKYLITTITIAILISLSNISFYNEDDDLIDIKNNIYQKANF